jgi:thymidylate synthase
MYVIEAESLLETIHRCLIDIPAIGQKVSPRDLATIEVRPAIIRISNPSWRVVCLPGRNANPCFAAAETLWIISGSDDPWIFDYNRALLKYANDGILKGAYGPRLRNWGGKDQIRWVIDVLRDDPASRRAVIQIFDPGSVDISHNDIPCTISFRFFIRDDRLCMHTLMRANDIWLGMPYDVFCFTVIQEIVAYNLGIPMGDYVHMVDSLHVYETDLARAQDIAFNPDHLQERFCRHHPIRIALDKLNADFRLALANGRSIPAELDEYATLLRLYKARKADQPIENSELDKLSPAFQEAFRIWR